MKFLLLFLAVAGELFVQSGYIYDKGLGTECTYDEDCVTRNSFCKGNKICACKIGYQYDPGSDVCFPKEVDLKCNEDYDCSALQNTRCSHGRCQCRFDYVPARDRAACLPSMRLTAVCEEDIQCNSVMNKSHCDPVTRQCVCQTGFKKDAYRMLCVEKSRLHNNCLRTADCEEKEEDRGKVVCKGEGPFSTCECADGYVERNDMCYTAGSSQAVLSTGTIIAFLLVKWFA